MKVGLLAPEAMWDTATNEIPTNQGRFSQRLADELSKEETFEDGSCPETCVFVLYGSSPESADDGSAKSPQTEDLAKTFRIPVAGPDFAILMTGWENAVRKDSELADYLKREPFDVLCAGTFETLRMALRLKQRGLTSRVLYTAHHLLRALRHWGVPLSEPDLVLEQQLLADVDAIVFPSARQQRLFDTYYGRKPSVHLETIYSGAPAHSGTASQESSLAPKSKNTSLFMASPIDSLQSDYETALYVLRRVVAAFGESVRLRIAGPESDSAEFGSDPELRRFLETAASLDLLRYIEFPGFLEREQMWEEYQRAHVTLLTSVTEAYGDVVAESLLEGTPVVATPVGAIPDFVSLHSHHGLLVPPRSPDDFAEAVFTILGRLDPTDSKDRLELLEKTRESFADDDDGFSWKTTATEYDKLFHVLADPKYAEAVAVRFRVAEVRRRLKDRLDGRKMSMRKLAQALEEGGKGGKSFESVRRIFDQDATTKFRWTTIEPIAEEIGFDEEELAEMKQLLEGN